MESLIIILLITTFVFVLMIYDNANISRCPYEGGKCFDGNGKYQYKGRGSLDETTDELLSRIDWLAKNSVNRPLYTSSYIIAYVLSLGVLFILYSGTGYLLSVWDYIIILIVSFIIVFSVTNLMNFHSERYPNYYIRQNISYINKKLGLKIHNPRSPKHDHIPHRTKVTDILLK